MIYVVRLFWGVPALLLLALLWLLSSPAGSQFILNQASQHSGGLLQAGTVTHGHLLGRLEVDQLSIRTDAAEVDLANVVLDWSPLSLLRLRAQVDQLSATSLDLRLLPTEETAADEPEGSGTPPSRLPVSVIVRQLAIDRITVTPAAGEPMQIDDLIVRADWMGSRVRVHQLALNWVDQFPLALTAQARLSPSGVSITPLAVTQPLMARLEGRYDYDGAFAAALEWADARWPIPADTAALIESPAGTLNIEGRPEAYRIRLNAKANSPDYAGAVILEGEGGLEEIILSTLDITALDGRAQASGKVHWAPTLEVDITASMADINPGVIAPQAPGRITGEIMAKGGLDADNPLTFSANIHDSELMKQPFALQVAGGWDQTREQLTLANARLSQGDTVLSAEGRAWPTLALKTRLESSDLSTLLPELRGRITLDAELDGNPTLPSVTARGEGSQLGWADVVHLAGLQLDGAFDPAGDLQLQVDATNISGAAEVDHLQLRANGTLDDHRLQLDADAPLGQASVTLAGAADLDRQQWQGTLEQLRLAVPKAPVVTLESPAPLMLSAAATRLDNACLRGAEQDQIKVCANADVTPERIIAKLLLDALDYALLTPFMPADLSLSGSVAGQMDVHLPTGKPPELEVDLNTRAGAFEIRNRPAMALLPGHIRAREDATGLQLDLDLPTHDGGLRAQLAAAPGADPFGRALNGSVTANLTDLGWISRLTPELEEIEGQLSIDLQVAGMLGAPEVGGRVALSVPQVSLPQAGITLRDTVAEIFPDGGTQARVAVHTTAGEGHLIIDGNVGWPDGAPQVALEIRGDNAQVADLPDARVWINPDLRIGLANNQLEINGRVDVPRAEITPRGGSDSGQGPAADQIIVRAGDQPPAAPLMDVLVNVTVALGDAVSFSGFGLKTRFAGQLTAQQRPGQPVTGRGEIRLVDGRYKAYGQDLEVATGRAIFSGGPITDPGLDLRAIREPRPDIEVGVTVRGRLDKPEFTLFSSPSMRQEEQLSWLVLGRGLQSQGDDNAALAGAALALGLSGSDFLAQRLKGGLVDDISIGTNPGEDPQEARLTVGRYLTPELYISYGVGLFQPGHVFRLLYDIGHGFQLQTETGVATGADLLYTLER